MQNIAPRELIGVIMPQLPILRYPFTLIVSYITVRSPIKSTYSDRKVPKRLHATSDNPLNAWTFRILIIDDDCSWRRGARITGGSLSKDRDSWKRTNDGNRKFCLVLRHNQLHVYQIETVYQICFRSKVEVTHGDEKQVIALPAERLDCTKRYFVTFTVRGESQGTTKSSPSIKRSATSV